MSTWRWCAIVIGLLCGGLAAALACYVAGPTWLAGSTGQITIAIGAVVIGAIPLVLIWTLGSAQQRQIRQLVDYLGSLSDQDDTPAPPQLSGGLAPVASAASRSLTGLKTRLRDLAASRRELDVQVRVCEAERRHLEAILNAMNDAVIVTDAFNEVALANDSAARLLEFDLQPSRRRPIDEVLRDRTLIKLIKDTREGGDASLRRHVEHRIGVNGQASIFNVTLASVAGATKARGDAQGCAGIVTILRDITREKEIAEMKSDFVSNVSHELRTPLSSIKAYVEMLVDGEAEDDQTRHEFYSIIQGEANRLSRLIDNILNISRIESGVVKVQREHLALPGLIREAVDIMQPQARAKDIELIEEISPLYFQVYGDRDMLLQSVLNLIGNAIKYTQNEGSVRVGLDVDEHNQRVRVRVTDTGVGIAEADVPHVFDKFYRVADHKRMAKGTGLGLNLVKHVVETVHDGEVSVTSELGVGSTFTFDLPIAENV